MSRRGALVCMVAALLLGYGVSLFVLQHGVVADLQRHLAQQLPVAMDAALVNGDQREQLFRHSEVTLRQQLQDLPMRSSLSGMTLGECSASQVHIGKAVGEREVRVRWRHEGESLQVGLALDCHPDHGRLLLQAAGLGLLAMMAIMVLPVPLSPLGRHWLGQLQQQGCSAQEARRRIQPLERNPAPLSPRQQVVLAQLVACGLPFEQACAVACDERTARLDDEQCHWLTLACRLGNPDPWTVADSDDRLCFDLPRGQVLIRGIPVSLTRTPLLYYCWYARQRQQDPEGEGWLTNPPSNRPDKTAGDALADFMADQQGHGRSISELRDKGLRAKTLDQNRNRIKEELTAVLGELAEPYLFDSTRCGNAARFRYRLRLDPAQIHFSP